VVTGGGGGGSLVMLFGPLGTFLRTEKPASALTGGGGGGSLVMRLGPVGTVRITGESTPVLEETGGGGGGLLVALLGPVGTFRSTEKSSEFERRAADAVEGRITIGSRRSSGSSAIAAFLCPAIASYWCSWVSWRRSLGTYL